MEILQLIQKNNLTGITTKYNEVFDKENKEKGILNNNIIFTTKYLYGKGKMYAKLSKDSEIHGKDFYKLFFCVLN